MERDRPYERAMGIFDGIEVRIPANEVSVPFTPELLEGRRREARSAPADPCWCCGSARWWRLKATARHSTGPWICARCHPALTSVETINVVDAMEVRDV